MDHLLLPRRVLAQTKTPWIFAFITTGLLLAIWGGLFLAWLFKRAREAHARRHGKLPPTPEKNVGGAVAYVMPPDPARIGGGMDETQARAIYAKEHQRKEKGAGKAAGHAPGDDLLERAAVDPPTQPPTPS